MHRLGYERYIAQGGDWGSVISTQLAIQDPEHCQAIHINFLPVPPVNKGFLALLKLGLTYLFPSLFLNPKELADVKEALAILPSETGYMTG